VPNLNKSLLLLVGAILFSACGFQERSETVLVDDDIQQQYNAKHSELQSFFAANNLMAADSLLGVMEAFTREKEAISLSIDLMSERSYFFLVTGQFERGFEFIEAVGDTVRQMGTQNQILAWISRKATFLNELGNHVEALEMCQEVLDATQDNPKQRIRMVAYTTMAMAYGYMYNYEKSLDAYQRSLELALELELEDRTIATIHNNIAVQLENMSRSDESLAELEKSLALNLRNNNILGVSQNLNNISNALRGLGRLQEAADTIRYGIELTRRGGQPAPLVRNLYNLGAVLIDLGELDEALEVLDEGYQLSTRIGFPPGVMYISSGLARYYNEVANNELASKYALESLEMARDQDVLEVQNTSYRVLSETYERQGRYREALGQFHQLKIIDDSLASIRNRREIEEVRSRFEFDIVASENELLRQQLSFAAQQRWNQAIILVFVLFSGIMLFVSVILLARQKRQIQASNAYLQELNKSREELVNVIVHDLRSPLSSLIATLDIIKTDYPTEDEDVREMLELADASGEKLRLMINGLLDVNSLEKENITEKLELTDVAKITRVALEHYEPAANAKKIRIESEIQTLLPRTHPEYFARILDNLMSNAIKYSHPGTTVRVRLHSDNNRSWKLVVKDEGQGFSEKDKQDAFKMFSRLSSAPTGNESSTGVGLFIIKLLTEKLGGTIKLKSEKDKGAEFTCTFHGLG
jgi:signal transduction histidine kinase